MPAGSGAAVGRVRPTLVNHTHRPRARGAELEAQHRAAPLGPARGDGPAHSGTAQASPQHREGEAALRRLATHVQHGTGPDVPPQHLGQMRTWWGAGLSVTWGSADAAPGNGREPCPVPGGVPRTRPRDPGTIRAQEPWQTAWSGVTEPVLNGTLLGGRRDKLQTERKYLQATHPNTELAPRLNK